MNEITLERSVFLYQTEGATDKEYHLHLRKKADGWVVDYANGRRGKVSGSKPIIETPTSYQTAAQELEKKLKSKLKDGYTESESGIRFTSSELQGRVSGHRQQLPSPITEDQARKLIDDPDYALQEKANGERRSIEFTPDGPQGVNKLGLYVNIPETWISELQTLGNPDLDAEQVGDTLWVFDLLKCNGQDSRQLPFKDRYLKLEEIIQRASTPSIKLLKAHFGREAKLSFLQEIESRRGEGGVFKDIFATYDAGRSASAFKYKFQESSTCITLKRNQQRSVQIGVRNPNGEMIELGNVTIPANQEVPNEGDLVEVQYLYYNPEGALEQPVYLGKRVDILIEEAVLSQITRLKPGIEMDENGNRVTNTMRYTQH